MGAWMTRQNIPLVSAAKPMADTWSQRFLIRLRDRLGMKVVFVDIPRSALRHLNQGGCFALLWDQRVTRSDEAAALFGQTVDLDPLPHFLIRHIPVPVFFGVLLPGGRFRLIQIAAPRQPPADPSQSAAPISRPAQSEVQISDGGPSQPARHAGSHPVSAQFTESRLGELAIELPVTGSSTHRKWTLGISTGGKLTAGRSTQGSLDPYRNLGRRYHRILECLVRAYPDHWYGLAHRRFAGATEGGVQRVAHIVPSDPSHHVSRETSAGSGVMVSRETKLSP